MGQIGRELQRLKGRMWEVDYAPAGHRETRTDCLCMSASFPHAYWSVKWPSSESEASVDSLGKGLSLAIQR